MWSCQQVEKRTTQVHMYNRQWTRPFLTREGRGCARLTVPRLSRVSVNRGVPLHHHRRKTDVNELYSYSVTIMYICMHRPPEE